MIKRYKNRKWSPRMDEDFKKGDNVVLHHKGFEYRAAKVLQIVKEGRRRYIVTAKMLDFKQTLKRPYHQFVKVRQDTFFEWCLRPFDRLVNKIKK